MIIFDLDGTLADCEHRRYFVDPKKNPGYRRRWNCTKDEFENNLLIPEEYIAVESTKSECYDKSYKKFKPDWKSFHQACDKDTPTYVVWLLNLIEEHYDVEIWTGRCASTKEKTLKWLRKNDCYVDKLKMRAVGDLTHSVFLKERWLDEAMAQGHTVEFVFDDNPDVIKMFRSRGIFVFDCNQSGGS